MNNNNQTFQGNGGSNDVFTPSTRSSYKFFNSTSSLDKTYCAGSLRGDMHTYIRYSCGFEPPIAGNCTNYRQFIFGE